MKGSQRQHTVLRGKHYSFLINKKAVYITLLLLLAVLALFIVSTGIGSVYIAPLDVIRSIFGWGDSASEMIVRSLRLPRIIVAILVGSSLAVSGALLQGVVRNPLASPDTIGITGGATLGAVTYFYFFSEVISIHMLPMFAILGACIISLVIYLLSWKQGVTPLRLILIGIGFSAAMSSITYMMMISGPIILANQSMTFMTGSVYGVSWAKSVIPLLPWVVILLPITFIYSRHINIQEMGEDVARSMGSAVQRQRFILILLSVALAGAAAAFGGAIGFIGLMAPHIARKLVGPSFGALIPASALMGAILLLVADLVGRTILSPLDIPAGVFTACIGAPFFVFLLYRTRNR